MNPVDPIELSGYMDGELDPARALEVASALDLDQRLQAEFELLASLDDQLQSTARLADFQVTIHLADAAGITAWAMSALVIGVLIGVRMIPKVTDAAVFAAALHAVALAALLVWVVRMAGGYSELSESRHRE